MKNTFFAVLALLILISGSVFAQTIEVSAPVNVVQNHDYKAKAENTGSAYVFHPNASWSYAETEIEIIEGSTQAEYDHIVDQGFKNSAYAGPINVWVYDPGTYWAKATSYAENVVDGNPHYGTGVTNSSSTFVVE